LLRAKEVELKQKEVELKILTKETMIMMTYMTIVNLERRV
jgi:hypothetical protein